MIATCKRCGGSYDMDMEEGWHDHHTAPNGSSCEPDPITCEWAYDHLGRYCIATHDLYWTVDFVADVDDEDVVDTAAAEHEPATAPSTQSPPDR